MFNYPSFSSLHCFLLQTLGIADFNCSGDLCSVSGCAPALMMCMPSILMCVSPYPSGRSLRCGHWRFVCTYMRVCFVLICHLYSSLPGEFVAAWQMNLTGLHPSQWYIPTTDLINIYSIAYVPSAGCVKCASSHHVYLMSAQQPDRVVLVD